MHKQLAYCMQFVSKYPFAQYTFYSMSPIFNSSPRQEGIIESQFIDSSIDSESLDSNEFDFHVIDNIRPSVQSSKISAKLAENGVQTERKSATHEERRTVVEYSASSHGTSPRAIPHLSSPKKSSKQNWQYLTTDAATAPLNFTVPSEQVTTEEKSSNVSGGRLIETKKTTTKTVYSSPVHATSTFETLTVKSEHLGNRKESVDMSQEQRTTEKFQYRSSKNEIRKSTDLDTMEHCAIEQSEKERKDRKEEKRRQKIEMKMTSDQTSCKETDICPYLNLFLGQSSKMTESTKHRIMTGTSIGVGTLVDPGTNIGVGTSVQTVQKQSLPGVNFGFQSDDLRFVTIPSELGISISCCCDLLFRPSRPSRPFGAVQLQKKSKKSSNAHLPGHNVKIGELPIVGSKVDQRPSVSCATSCGD